LVDFGMVRRVHERMYSVCGSIEYMAPEVVLCSGYDTSADYWSLGCLVYELVVGHTPWMLDDDGVLDMSMSDATLTRNICDASRAIAYPAPAADGGGGDAPSAVLRALISGWLERTPGRRLGCSNEGAAAIRRAPFFDGLDWDALHAQTLPVPPTPAVAAPPPPPPKKKPAAAPEPAPAPSWPPAPADGAETRASFLEHLDEKPAAAPAAAEGGRDDFWSAFKHF